MTVANKSQEYTTAGSHTFNVPAACAGFVFVTGVGAGGAGGWSNTGFSAGAGGGGGGESVEGHRMKVTPGGTLSVVVGAGGTNTATPTVQSLLPFHASPGSIYVRTDIPPGDTPEYGRGGGFVSAGDGGGLTTIGTVGSGGIRLSGGAGAVGGTSSCHGGMGGGIVAYKGSGVNGNQGESLAVGAGGSGSIAVPSVKNSPRFFSGAGGGAGGYGGGPAPDYAYGGDGGTVGFSPQSAGGTATSTKGGAGGGGASLYGMGGYGGNAAAAGQDGQAAGSGGGGGDGDNNQGDGRDGYVLLTWFETT